MDECEVVVPGGTYGGMLRVTNDGLKSWRIELAADMRDLVGVRIGVVVKTATAVMSGLAFVTGVTYDIERQPEWLSVLDGDGPLGEVPTDG
jgi:hypothetical protein